MASQPFDEQIWKKRVSVNAAGALVLFALLHILCFAAASPGAGVMRLMGLALPVIAAVPLAGRFEAHWHRTRDVRRFRRAAGLAWAGAAIVPFLWSGAWLLLPG